MWNWQSFLKWVGASIFVSACLLFSMLLVVGVYSESSHRAQPAHSEPTAEAAATAQSALAVERPPVTRDPPAAADAPFAQTEEVPAAVTPAAPEAGQIPARPEPAAIPIEVTAKDLFSAYEENEVAADHRYKGKLLSVTGSVRSVGRDLSDVAHVYLDGGGILFGVDCRFAPKDEEFPATLRAGMTVSITGTGDGKFGGVNLRQCAGGKILEAQTSEPANH